MTRFYFSLIAGLLLFAHPVLAAQTLEETLVLAYQRNPLLKTEQAKLRATDEKVSLALSGWRPSIDAVGGVGSSQQKMVGTGTDTLSPRDVGITVTQPVFRGFRTKASVESAEAQVRASRAMLQEAEQKLLFEASKAYLDVVQGQTVLGFTRANEEVLEEQRKATNSRFGVGEVTKTDISQSEARLSSAMALRVRAEGDLANAQATFVRIVGSTSEKLEQPHLVLSDPVSVEEAIALAEKNNPSVISAIYNQDAAKADTVFAQGSLLPEVNIVGNASRGWEQSLLAPNRQDQATVMARVIIPLYRAGTDYSKTRASQEMQTQRRMELEDARQRSHEIVVQAWQNLKTARAAIAAHKSEVSAADMALLGVREEEKVGTRTTLDVLNAQQELLNSKVNLVKAEHDEALAILQVKMSVGELTADSLGLKVSSYNPSTHYDQVRSKWGGATLDSP